MHLAFLEAYPHPSTWYYKRLAYTRSAGVASIVGYVMGIGDRHPQNIMFDTRTAELLHIDFGIAFEQVRVGWGALWWCPMRARAPPPASSHHHPACSDRIVNGGPLQRC
jgi:hypothetical protein